MLGPPGPILGAPGPMPCPMLEPIEFTPLIEVALVGILPGGGPVGPLLEGRFPTLPGPLGPLALLPLPGKLKGPIGVPGPLPWFDP